jgi:flagellar export protein FliJ
MAKFVFRLQALLDQRSHEERQKQLAVAAVERERAALEAEIAGHQRVIGGFKEDIRAMLASGGVDVREVRLQAAASLHAQAATQRKAIKLAGVYQRLESARGELRAVATRRRAVELLKEKRFEHWKDEIKRKEGIELDEIGTLRAARLARSSPTD